MDQSRDIQIVVVGDEKSGKTSLISRFINNFIPTSYKPTSFDKFLATKEVCGDLYNLTVWDTSGSQNFDTVRPLSYGEADVFIICFNISDPLSLYNVKSRWIREIDHHSTAPILLCGNMADLRGDEATVQHLSRLGRSPVTPDQAIAIGVQINARNYIETAAAVSYVETFELFSLAAMSALEFRRIHCPAPEPAPGPFQRPGSVASHHSNVSLSRGGHVPGHNSSFHGIKQSSSSQYCGSQNSLQELHRNSDTSLTRGQVTHVPRSCHTGSVPTSPVKTGLNSSVSHNDTQPVHFRSSSHPVRSCLDLNSSKTASNHPDTLRTSSPHSPPPPRPIRSHLTSPSTSSCQSESLHDNPELRKSGAHISRKTSFRSSMPVATGKPPLPTSALHKSPTELLQLTSQRSAITTEPGVGGGPKSRLTQLGVPEGKNYESLKSHTSTVSHGSTGSKMSSTSSQLSAQGWSGPRDMEVPDTEDPDVLRNLEFVSPKAGVYRPIHNSRSSAAVKKDKCSVM